MCVTAWLATARFPGPTPVCSARDKQEMDTELQGYGLSESLLFAQVLAQCPTPCDYKW